MLEVNSVCGIGSTGRIATGLHAALAAQGHQCTIAYGRADSVDCNQTIRIGDVLDNYLHVARTRLLDDHGFGSAQATRRFVSRVRALKPDLIHLHNLHGYYLHVGVLFEFLHQYGKPVVWTLHDCWPFTGHCAHFDFVGCTHWKTECHNCPQRADYPASLLRDGSKANFQRKKMIFTSLQNLTIVTPSQWLASLVEESFLQGNPRLVINNGINLKIFRPSPSSFRKQHGLTDMFVVLGVASVWSARKGLQYFIELAKHLRQDERIVMVGLSEQQIRQLPAAVVGIPKMSSSAELAALYSAADVFVNPTLEDTFPTTNLEALACGTPVVTFGTGGSPECLDASCGLVVERGDLPGLIAAIAKVREAGKASFSMHCRHRAEQRYNESDRTADYLELYEGRLNR